MFAVTERLLLRPGWAEDAPALARALSDEAVVRNLSRVPWPYALDDAARFLALPHDSVRPHFLLTRRDDGALIGGIGITGEQAELGYWLARAHWGRGYAREAAEAVIAMADNSLRLPVLHAAHALDNPASGRVLARLGFAPSGTTRRHSAARGCAMDVRLLTRARAAREASPLAA